MLKTIILLLLCTFALGTKIQKYPLSDLDASTYNSYRTSDVIKLQCIRRHINNGEHMFDEKGDIIYGDFATCLETKEPLSFSYKEDSNIKCTIKLEDELYHLFQLYLHKDAPFTCRMELRPKSGIYLPIDFSLRGNVLESHFDIDPNVNVLLLTNEDNEIVSGTAFSSSLNTTKAIIGDNVEMTFNLRWLNLPKEETTSGIYFFKLPAINNPLYYYVYCVAGGIAGFVLAILFSYKRLNKKIQLSNLNKVE